MASEAWKLAKPSGATSNSLIENSIASGTSSVQVELTPKRQLLHELVTQLVTERKIDINPSLPYEMQLDQAVREVKSTDIYKALEKNASYSANDISKAINSLDIPKLPLAPKGQHTTFVITGGTGVGKSSLAQELALQHPNKFAGSIKINPDDYREILAPISKHGTNYAEFSQKETSILTDKIYKRIELRLDNGSAPNVVMDIAVPSNKRMELLQKSNQVISVAGAAPVEVTLQRAYDRFNNTGRIVPTEVNIATNKSAVTNMSNLLQHPNAKFSLYDTDVPKGETPKLIASWNPDTKQLNVKQPDKFIDFVERQHLEVKASNPDELLLDKRKTPEQIYRNLKRYTDKGVEINFLDSNGDTSLTISKDSVAFNGKINSSRGESFFEKVGESSVKEHPKPIKLENDPADLTKTKQTESPSPLDKKPSTLSLKGKKGGPIGIVVGAAAAVVSGVSSAMTTEGSLDDKLEAGLESGSNTAQDYIPIVNSEKARAEGKPNEATARYLDNFMIPGEIYRHGVRTHAAITGSPTDVEPGMIESFGQSVADNIKYAAKKAAELVSGEQSSSPSPDKNLSAKPKTSNPEIDETNNETIPRSTKTAAKQAIDNIKTPIQVANSNYFQGEQSLPNASATQEQSTNQTL